MRESMDQENQEKGLQLMPGSRLSKQEIIKKLELEEKCMLKEERMKIACKLPRLEQLKKFDVWAQHIDFHLNCTVYKCYRNYERITLSSDM